MVCAHNELENLKILIPKLLYQDHPDFEVIIVNDRSEDSTYDYMLEHKTDQLKFVNIDKVHDHINAKKYAITLGVKAAKNDLLLFIDADCEPNSNQWAKLMTQSFSKTDNFVLGVSQYSVGKGILNHFIRLETLWTAINYIGFALLGNPYMAVGRNLAYRKSSFLEHKGFNKFQHITGGDDDLLVNQFGNKKNTQVVISAESLTYSIPKKSWSEYFRQKVRHLSVSKYYRFKDKILLGLQNLSHSLFWIAFISLATLSTQYSLLAGMVLLRMILILNLAFFTSKKFGDRINLWFVPFFDIIYVLYINVFGIRGLFTRKVKWK
ncbi:MAG: glycosyltransferase [Reichenbachiella sp.]